MKQTLEKITKELNLRKPQEQSLIKLDALMSTFKIGENVKDVEAKLVGNIKFDTNFPSFTLLWQQALVRHD